MNSLVLLTAKQNDGYISDEKTKERIEKGSEIYNNGLVEQVNEHLFIVKGQYEVKDIGDIEPILTCTCNDFEYRGVICKHIFSVQFKLMDQGA